MPLIFSQSTVPFVTPFNYNWIIANAKCRPRTLIVVTENQIRSKRGRGKKWICFDCKMIDFSYFLILIFGHLQSRSFANTKSDTFCRFANPFTTLSSVFLKIAFTWSVNFTDSDLLWSSMDFVVGGMASRAITLAMIAAWRRDRKGKKEVN